MREENKIDRAYEISETARGARQAHRTASQGCEDMFDGQRRRDLNTGIVPSESMEPMRVGRCDQRFAKARCQFHRSAIRIKQTHVEMAELDGVETIYFLE
jgi:hypothetical protein